VCMFDRVIKYNSSCCLLCICIRYFLHELWVNRAYGYFLVVLAPYYVVLSELNNVYRRFQQWE